MFLLFLFGLIFFTTLITHYFFSFDGISITESPLRDDTGGLLKQVTIADGTTTSSSMMGRY